MNAKTWIQRRSDLAEMAQGGLLVIPGARNIPMNIPMNHAPFRQTSHMLFLAGNMPPDSALIGDPDRDHWELLVPTPPEGDEIWHGKTPSPHDIAAKVGILVVHDTASFKERVKALAQGRPVWSLPAPDPIWLDRLRDAGIDTPSINGGLPRLAHNPLADAMIRLRNIKSGAEVAQMQTAADLTVRVHKAVMAATQAGQTTEAGLKALVDGMFTAAGCRAAYDPIITVRGDILHQRAGSATVQPGQLLLVDVGAELPSGYCADVTRTFPVNGVFDDRQRAIYDVVLEAQRVAIEACKPGTRYSDLHLATSVSLAQGLIDLGILKGTAEDCVATDAHALFFPHGLGHLLGLDVHDLEDLGDRAGYAPGWNRADRFGLAWLRLDRLLEPGMYVTIEPGLYFIEALLQDPEVEARHKAMVNFDVARRYLGLGGVRIEDDVLITGDGNRALTANAPKSRDAIEALVGSAPGMLAVFG